MRTQLLSLATACVLVAAVACVRDGTPRPSNDKLAWLVGAVDLPLAARSETWDLEAEEQFAALLLLADGTLKSTIMDSLYRPGESEKLLRVWMYDTAARMLRHEDFASVPGESLLLAADRGSAWSSVDRILAIVQYKDVLINQIDFLALGEGSGEPTLVSLQLPLDIGVVHVDKDAPPPTWLPLSVTSEGAYVLEGEEHETLGAVLAALDALEARLCSGEGDQPGTILDVQPEPGAPWGSVLPVIEKAEALSDYYRLGEHDISSWDDSTLVLK